MFSSHTKCADHTILKYPSGKGAMTQACPNYAHIHVEPQIPGQALMCTDRKLTSIQLAFKWLRQVHVVSSSETHQGTATCTCMANYALLCIVVSAQQYQQQEHMWCVGTVQMRMVPMHHLCSTAAEQRYHHGTQRDRCCALLAKQVVSKDFHMCNLLAILLCFPKPVLNKL